MNNRRPFHGRPGQLRDPRPPFRNNQTTTQRPRIVPVHTDAINEFKDKPTARDSAKSVMILMEKPATAIMIKAPSSEFGRAKEVMSVERRDPKKKKTTKTVKIIPITIVSFTSATFARMGLAPS